MVLDNYIEQEIDGTTYKLCLNNMAIFQAERELASGKLLQTMQDPPPSMGDMFTLFKWSLIGGKQNISQEKALELFFLLNNEIGTMGIFNIILEVLKKAQIFSPSPKKAAKKKA